MTFHEWAVSRGYRYNDETGFWLSPDGEILINPNEDSGAGFYGAMLAEYERAWMYGTSGGSNDTLVFNGFPYTQIAGWANNGRTHAESLQIEIDHLKSFGIVPVYTEQYGWIAPIDARLNLAHPLQSNEDWLDKIIAFGIPAIVQFGMGLGLNAAFASLTGASQAAAIAEDTFSMSGAGIIESSAASSISSVLPSTTQLISKIPNITYRLSQGADPESLIVSTFITSPATGYVSSEVVKFVTPYANYVKDYIAGLVSESDVVDVLDSQILAQVDELSFNLENEITTDATAYDAPVQTMVASSETIFDAGVAPIGVAPVIEMVGSTMKDRVYADLESAHFDNPDARNLTVDSEGYIHGVQTPGTYTYPNGAVITIVDEFPYILGRVDYTNLNEILGKQLETAEIVISNVATQIAEQSTVTEFVEDAAQYGDVWSYTRDIINQVQAYALAAAATRNYEIESAIENQIEIDQDLLIQQTSAIITEKAIEKDTDVARAVAAQDAANQAMLDAERTRLIQESQSAQDAAVARAIAAQAAADQAVRDAERARLIQESQSAQDAAVARAVAAQDAANRAEYENRVNEINIQNAARIAEIRQQEANNAEILRSNAQREMESAVSRAIEQQRIADDAAREAALSRQMNESIAQQNAAVTNATNQQRIADSIEREAALSEARSQAAADKANALQDAANRAANERAMLEAQAENLRHESAIRQSEADTLANNLRRSIESGSEQTAIYQNILRERIQADVEADRAAWENVATETAPLITNDAYERLAEAQANARLEAERQSQFDKSVAIAVNAATSALLRTLLQNQNRTNANVVQRSPDDSLLQTEAKPNSMLGLLFLVGLALDAVSS